MSPDIPLENRPETAYCIVTAAHRYQLPPEALLAVLLREAGQLGMKKKNSNASFDLGPMQVNTVWLDPTSPLRDYLTTDVLANNLCSNIHTGAWILAKHKEQTKDMWRAIAYYHSKNPVLGTRYMYLVNEKLPKARQLINYSPVYQSYIKLVYGIKD
jgi:soluble lytic murein transglycosylase-like protein